MSNPKSLNRGAVSRRQLGLLVPLLLALSASSADSEEIVVAVSSIPPLVVESDGEFSGFDIELWEAIAHECGLDFSYRQVAFKEIIPNLIAGEVAVGLAGITINREREGLIDFSHSYLDSGLRILVPSETNASLMAAVSAVFTPSVLKAMAVLFAFTFLFGHLLWWSERGETAIHDRYFPGIFEAFWCVLATMTTVGYGDIAPRRWLGRLAALAIMVCGIGLFGVIVAQLSAEMNFQKLVSEISSHKDLAGKAVATVEGTTSVAALQDLGAKVVTVERIEWAYEKLLQGEVAAVVFDAPTLLLYARRGGGGEVAIVGDLFDPQPYGIALPEGSPLREPINRALLGMRENGQYDRIYRKYFGPR